MKALIVEDSPEVIESIVLCLTIRWPNIGVIATDSGVEAVQLTRSVAPDILLLDLGLADLYGLQVLKEIRGFSAAPMIIITANGEETSRLKSFEMGTDDYLVKPFSHIELLGSITAALGHAWHSGRNEGGDAVKGRGLVVDIPGRRVLCDGDEVSLTLTEWNILLALIHDPGRIVPYAKVGQAGWGTKSVTRSVIRAYIQRLGSKLGDAPQRLSVIQNWENEGYSFALMP